MHKKWSWRYLLNRTRWVWLGVFLLWAGLNSASALMVATQSANRIRSTTAILNGAVLPEDAYVTVWFEWGEEGQAKKKTAKQRVSDGFEVKMLHVPIVGLKPGGIYEFQLVVGDQNGKALKRGWVQRFTTGQSVVAWGYGADNSRVPVELSDVVATRAGRTYNISLLANGRVVEWSGKDVWTNLPPGLEDVADVAAGPYHRLALRADGQVIGWGLDYEWSNHLSNVTNAVAIAAGSDHNAILREDGQVAFGYETKPFTNVFGLNDVVAVAAGGDYGLALQIDGRVVAWRVGYAGRTVLQTNVPANLRNVVAVAAGGTHSLALRSDGRVVGWSNDGTRQNAAKVPAGLSNVVAIAAAPSHSLALKKDGSLVLWGDAWDLKYLKIPSGLGRVIQISSGPSQNQVLTKKITRPGMVPPGISQTVVVAPGEDNVLQLRHVDGGRFNFHVMSLPPVGRLYQYKADGRRGARILLPGTQVQDAAGRIIYAAQPGGWGKPAPQFLFVVSDGRSLSASASVTLKLREVRFFTLAATPLETNRFQLNGAVLGNGLATKAWFEWGPMGKFTSRTGLTNLGTGLQLKRLQVTLDDLPPRSRFQGRLVVSNTFGIQRGRTELFTTGQGVAFVGLEGYVPTNGYGKEIVGLDINNNYRMFLRADGQVVVDGTDQTNLTQLPSQLGKVTAISAGLNHCLALQTDGQVVAWGDNSRGQTDLPAGLGQVIAISTRGRHSLALQADGTVVAWGDNSHGQTEVPSGLSNVVAVVAGENYSFALQGNGEIAVWGGKNLSPDDERVVIPPGTDHTVALASTDDYSFALEANGTVVQLYQNDFYSVGHVFPSIKGHGVAALVTEGDWVGILRTDGRLAVLDGEVWRPELHDLVAADFDPYGYGAVLRALPPQALNQEVDILAGQDVDITLTATDPNNDPLVCRIMSLPAKGKLYQCVNGQRGDEITATNTMVTDAQNRVVYVLTELEAGRPLANFSFVANDGDEDSAPAFVKLAAGLTHAITLPVSPGGISGMRLHGGGHLGLPSQVGFEWGPRGTTSFNYAAVTNYPQAMWFSRTDCLLTNLPNRGDFQYRLAVSNAAGWHYGNWLFFAMRSKPVRLEWYDGNSVSYPELTNVVAMDAGEYEDLFLRRDGTIHATYDYLDLAGFPEEAKQTPLVALSANNDHHLAVLEGGKAVGWGYLYDNHYLQIPEGLSNVVAVSAARNFGLALGANGRVTALGNAYFTNHYGGIEHVEKLSNIVAVAATDGDHYPDYSYSLALRADGRVEYWGSEAMYAWSGFQPFLKGLSNVVAMTVSPYGEDVAVVFSDGRAATWDMYADTPTNYLAAYTNVVAVSAEGYPAALLADGRVVPAGSSTPSAINNALAQVTNAVAVAEGLYGVLVLVGEGGGPFPGEEESPSRNTRLVVPLAVPPVLQPRMTGGPGQGTFALRFQGIGGGNYHVWVSEDLQVWQDLGRALETAPGEFDFTDVSGSGQSRRFYKVGPP